jgi:hypothetical protein
MVTCLCRPLTEEATVTAEEIEMTAAGKPSPIPDAYRRVTTSLVVHGAASA